MKNIPLIAALMVSSCLNAQYYYNDIIANRDINNKMKTLLAAKVQSVMATGYDEYGKKSTDFNEWQEVQANGTILKITTRTGQNAARSYYQFDNNTRLISSRDSSADALVTTNYTYDNNGNLSSIKMTRKDSLHDFDQTEDRQWQYTPAGKPLQVLRIANGTDSTEYRFTLDEKGNVADETMFRWTRGVYFYYDDQKIYYYYDDKGRLTDIVRYNRKLKQLVPDYTFEYDDNDRVIQKITALSNTANFDYFIWRYGFNDKGLKTREKMFSKTQRQKGSIDYSYTYSQ